jgi:hypothetical protein
VTGAEEAHVKRGDVGLIKAGGQVKRIYSSLLSFVMFVLVSGSAVCAEKPVVGWLESARILPDGLILEAKLDTGADNTSLDARNITVTRRDGKNIIRFNVDDRKGKTVTLEKEQVGIELVPQHHGDDEERPLVILEICLGNECRNTLVNLVDRSKKKYPLLVGRSFMLDRLLVDTGGEHLAQPRGQEGKKP